MSYCVNCGVELHETEKSCPLCTTVVINPNQLYNEDAKPLYPPHKQHADLQANKRVTVALISVLLALPASVCLVCNYVIDTRLTWSMYVLGTMAFLWTVIIPPYLLRRNRELMTVIIGGISSCAFLRFLEEVSPVKGWYLTLALPIVLVVAFICFIMVIIFLYSNLRKMQIAAVFAVCVAGMMIAVEIATDVYHQASFKLEWSVFFAIPCIIVAVLFMLIDRKRSVKENIKKTFHV